MDSTFTCQNRIQACALRQKGSSVAVQFYVANVRRRRNDRAEDESIGIERDARDSLPGTSDKTVSGVIENITRKASEFGFIVRHVFDMKAEYGAHQVELDSDFALHQVMVCSMNGSFTSMSRNMERAALIYQPKQIVVFTDQGTTTVNYCPLSEQYIAEAFPTDRAFSEGLSRTCRNIVEMIKASV